MFNLDYKNILLTGASRGLGQVCAQALADHHANLALVARNIEALQQIKAQCHRSEYHIAIPTDLTDMAATKDMVSKVSCFFKDQIHCVLHVAGGGLGLKDHLLNMDDIMRLFALNVASAAEINRLIAPKMISRRSGNLVHVASIASSEATGSVGYNTVKAAMAAYVRSLGRELAPSGVVVTGILPGGFYAPGNSWIRLEQQQPEIVQAFVRERLPRGHLAQAKELIPLLLYLCSDAASMMGGCMVPIDAGEGKSYA